MISVVKAEIKNLAEDPAISNIICKEDEEDAVFFNDNLPSVYPSEKEPFWTPLSFVPNWNGIFVGISTNKIGILLPIKSI